VIIVAADPRCRFAVQRWVAAYRGGRMGPTIAAALRRRSDDSDRLLAIRKGTSEREVSVGQRGLADAPTDVDNAVPFPFPQRTSLLGNDVGITARSAGRWDDWQDTAPGWECRNAGINFGGWTNHSLGPR
jgi:hypothetical protein